MKISFRQNLQTVYKNKPLLTLLASLLIINLVNGIRQSIQLYYVVYVWGDAGYATQVGISLVVGMLLGMTATPPLLRRFSKKKVFILSCILGSLSCILPYLFGDHNVMTTLVFFAVSFFFSGMTTIVSTSMLLDTIDYSEWKLGFRGEGLCSPRTPLSLNSAGHCHGSLSVQVWACSAMLRISRRLQRSSMASAS